MGFNAVIILAFLKQLILLNASQTEISRIDNTIRSLGIRVDTPPY